MTQANPKKDKGTPRFSLKIWTLVCCVFTGIFLAIIHYLPCFLGTSGFLCQVWNVFFSILFAVLGGTIYYVIWYLVERRIYNRVRQEFQQLQIKEETQKLQEQLESNFFTNLVKINFKYLDAYYLQTQVQAEKSFLLSALAAIIGLGIIIAGIVMMFLDKTKPAYVTTGAGILSEFIAAILFYLYNRTILKMSEYHQKLVITQNISLALRIAETLPDSEKTGAQVELIKALSQDVNKHLTGISLNDDLPVRNSDYLDRQSTITKTN